MHPPVINNHRGVHQSIHYTFPRIFASDLVLVSRVSRFPSSPGLKKQDRAAHALAKAAAAGARPKKQKSKTGSIITGAGGRGHMETRVVGKSILL